jgi:transposase-like protein
MKKAKHTEEKIIGAVKQLEAGRPVKELARELGVTDQTLYNWSPSTAAWRCRMQGNCARSKMRTGG